uniref:Uncharacterized protein n=1 Tax=Anguilla anguilla TaxID=7936 RepID=A0A0E9X3S6_ANGAN
MVWACLTATCTGLSTLMITADGRIILNCKEASAHVQANPSKLFGWRFILLQGNDNKHTAKETNEFFQNQELDYS